MIYGSEACWLATRRRQWCEPVPGPCGAEHHACRVADCLIYRCCCLQIRGIKTNIPFMENVLRHPVFLAGAATTGFIETYSKDLFKFEGHSNIRANKLLLYLADMVS